MTVGEGARVAVVMGGTSSEHPVSVCSGLNVLAALRRLGYAAVPVLVARDGNWYVDHLPPEPDLTREPPATLDDTPDRPPTTGLWERLRGGEFDVVFIALHGPGGEDGTIQGMLQTAGVPFTGSGVLASSLAMSKPLTKRLLAALDVPFPADLVLRRNDSEDAVPAVLERVGLPCVVKPAAGGSSFGTRVVEHAEDLVAALDDAWREDGDALVERFVVGVEVTCGVLGGGCDPLTVLPLTEISPRHDGFFDFRAKYTATACDEITPARVDPAVRDRVQALARRAHQALGCEGMSRSDFIVTKEGPVMLEINTIPGMTATSLLPQGAAAAGIDFDSLVERLVAGALRRDPRGPLAGPAR